jgi:hypothetical protein
VKKITSILIGTVFSGISVSANAAVLFNEDFESGSLAQWTTGNAQIVADIVDPSNSVLSFTGLNSAGDIFSTSSLFSSNSNLFTLSFDYLGDNNNSGGFFGYSQGLPGNHVWLAGSDTNYSGTTLWQDNLSGSVTDRILVGDGSWQHYSFTFASSFNPIHLMIEDFVGADNVAGNAYFDNIVLTDAASVAEPSILALFGMGLLGMSFFRKKVS